MMKQLLIPAMAVLLLGAAATLEWREVVDRAVRFGGPRGELAVIDAYAKEVNSYTTLTLTQRHVAVMRALDQATSHTDLRGAWDEFNATERSVMRVVVRRILKARAAALRTQATEVEDAPTTGNVE